MGNLNLILVIALSQAWLHEEVALFQHFGTLAGKSLQDMEALKGSGFVCARQKWVVCARQTVGRLCTFLLCVFVIVSL